MISVEPGSLFCLHVTHGRALGKTTELRFGALQLVVEPARRREDAPGTLLLELNEPSAPLHNFLAGSPDPIVEVFQEAWEPEVPDEGLSYEGVRYVFPTRRWWRRDGRLHSITAPNERVRELGFDWALGGWEMLGARLAR